MSCKKGIQVAEAFKKYITTTNGFEKCLKMLKIVECDNGTMKAEFCVTEEHLNERGFLHGGLIMALIDSVSTRALMSNERNTPRGVSVELSTSFLRAAELGDTVEVLATTLKTGKILGFLEVQVRNKCTNEILAVGKHTKYITP